MEYRSNTMIEMRWLEIEEAEIRVVSKTNIDVGEHVIDNFNGELPIYLGKKLQYRVVVKHEWTDWIDVETEREE